MQTAVLHAHNRAVKSDWSASGPSAKQPGRVGTKGGGNLLFEQSRSALAKRYARLGTNIIRSRPASPS